MQSPRYLVPKFPPERTMVNVLLHQHCEVRIDLRCKMTVFLTNTGLSSVYDGSRQVGVGRKPSARSRALGNSQNMGETRMC